MTLPSIDSLRAASERIDRVFLATPQYRAESLSELLGFDLLCKVETQNPIGCFKGRGADWWMQCRNPDQVVCATAGNLGQAVAYVCRRHAREAHLFVQRGANAVKVRAMERLGAHVHEAGTDFDAAKADALAYAAARGVPFLDDGRDVEIAAGFGTIAVELCRESAPLDALYVPVGSGALAIGCGAWLRALAPATRLVGVCATGAPAMQRSFESGQVVTTEHVDTIAAGVGVRVPVAEAVSALRSVADEVVLVDDAQIRKAMQMLFRYERLLAEPSGAVALAGLLARASSHTGQRVAVVITGANLDDAELARLLETT